jgi:predicted dehydrogenase
MEPTRVGIVGCGNIGPVYLRMLSAFDFIEVTACADLLPERAAAMAAGSNVAVLPVDDLLAAPDIDVVANLTPPLVHAELSLAALSSGKHVYSEKPLGVTLAQADRIMDEARARNRAIGCAPDTFLGGGHQTVRRLIDEGAIGAPVAATALMMLPGHEHWHPDPAFFYKPGAGPMLDVGPYYVTNLVSLLGPVCRASGMARRTRATRPVLSAPRHGEIIDVEVPTHIAGTLEFACGAIVSIVTSFDVVRHRHNQMELYGLDGTIVTPDPNRFGGTAQLFRRGDADWHEMPCTHGYIDGNLRGIGLADMVKGLREGRPWRCGAALARHVLEVMLAVQHAAADGGTIEISSRCERPAPLPSGLAHGQLD